MINITLKAKHFYYIVFYLRRAFIENYFSLVYRLKTALTGNTDFDASISVSATVDEVINIYKTLTVLPEGESSTINVEMLSTLEPQIVAGIKDEQTNGIVPDIDGNLPNNAYWQLIAKGINFISNNNINNRNIAIEAGKALIDGL